MNSYWTIAAFSAALAFTIAVVAAVPAAWLARQIGGMAGFNDRSIHREPVPLLGGVAIVTGVIAGGVTGILDGWLHVTQQMHVVWIGCAAATIAVGAADDLKGIRQFYRLILSALMGLGLWIAGLRVELLGGVPIGAPLSMLLTILCVSGYTTAINFIDGLDGLAAGLSIVAAAALGICAMSIGLYQAVVLCALVAGASGGFLVHNRHPARQFMGEIGSSWLGFSLATATLLIARRTPEGTRQASLLLAGAVPILDTFITLIRRATNGRGLLNGADREHMHHMLLQAGLSHRDTVRTLWSAGAVFAVLGVWGYTGGVSEAPVLLLVAVLGGWMLIRSLGYGVYLRIAVSPDHKIHTADSDRRNRFHLSLQELLGASDSAQLWIAFERVMTSCDVEAAAVIGPSASGAGRLIWSRPSGTGGMEISEIASALWNDLVRETGGRATPAELREFCRRWENAHSNGRQYGARLVYGRALLPFAVLLTVRRSVPEGLCPEALTLASSRLGMALSRFQQPVRTSLGFAPVVWATFRNTLKPPRGFASGFDEITGTGVSFSREHAVQSPQLPKTS